MVPLLITLLVIAGLALYVVGLYNNLVTLRNLFKNAFAQIDVQLKRRYDLIPNLVETAKAYMKHEREALEAVIAARNTASTTAKRAAAEPGEVQAMTALAGTESALSGALGRLFALAEAYPDLKANQTMMQLSEELTSTENRVGFARQAYNDAVLDFNNGAGQFPANIVAGVFGFAPAGMLQSTQSEQERQAPRVQF